MADKRLDQVTKVTDMAYVPVIMSDGSIGQIAKADLATVVAGIMFPGMNSNVNGLKSGTLNLESGVDISLTLGAGMLFVYTTGAQNFRAFGINYWGSTITTIFSDTSQQGYTLSKNASSAKITFTPDRDRIIRYVFIGEAIG